MDRRCAVAAESSAVEERQQRYRTLITRAWTDAAFKARLLADPTTVLTEAGLDVPPGKRIAVLEPNPETTYLMLVPLEAVKDPSESKPWARSWDALVACAAADAAFKARLAAEPEAVLREAGVPVPEGRTLQLIEPTETSGYLLLPPQPEHLPGSTGAEDAVSGYLLYAEATARSAEPSWLALDGGVYYFNSGWSPNPQNPWTPSWWPPRL
jgi:hypothetical protein